MQEETIYEELGVPRVVNAAGTKTRIGGSLIRPEAVEAMSRAAESFVRLSDLQVRAGELISEVTGAEAGYVGSGAAACMTLAAAAAIAGDDLGTMSRLPETEGIADEIVMPRTHRNGYDHAFRAAGARIVDVGNNDNYLGTGSNSTEPWEIADAITEDTVAVGYMEKAFSTPPLEEVIRVAHDHDVPVIVDAAAEVPPRENLSAFVDAGADMVVFSGGKAIRGPQTTGILAGRQEYVRSAALQHLDMHVAESVWEPPTELFDKASLAGVPRQGIGRPLKVGKEEVVGLIAALEAFVEEDQDALDEEWNARLDIVEKGLDEIAGVTTRREPGGKLMVAPEVHVEVDPAAAGTDAVELVGSLRTENPRIFVGSDDLLDDAFTVNPMCLTDEEAGYVAERIQNALE
ncbi:aminotransferase class V-fold PLP-dependent enzyme [Halogeometricum sp. S1BR25-6]|uniref:Aminotransferase class V-fold PLP-dependent enzyme n=1 Tax=Halogeometricum salsisoli TaxID=2950536 RepID=A0ABU2GK15_9EURY|nr:aminotransferase class V-fold PLP-dependent enzyme [Halogeometricum sp. S1BR25-6]MDS0301156.1 aminotransferase class V-fold PLP-dependent enzyme [Halogeometricum sp. S1BR25-6]